MACRIHFTHIKLRIALIVPAIIFIAVGTFIKTDQIAKLENNRIINVTIFVHGIISVKPFLSFANFVKLVRDNIADSTYARTVEIIRKDPFFFQYHPMQEIGLHEIDLKVIEPGNASCAFARTFDQLQQRRNNTDYKYYTFGWSGLLSPRMRYLEAKLFYQSISALDDQLRVQGFIPHYTVVAYSHGGNVAFKMADVHENENYRNNNLIIDNLWLIGVPVLPDSLSCLYSSLFKEIIHIYSVRDRIQPLDCFAVNRFFSSRMFTQTTELPLPKNLTQIQLSIRRPVNKIYSLNQKKYDNFLIKSSLRNADPGHTELWSFGWVTSSYRENHPFYPLPTSVFMPFIVDCLHQNNIRGQSVLFEMHPYCQKVCIKINNIKLVLPFVNRECMTMLQQDALQYQPAVLTGDLYKQKILLAMERAKKEKREERARTKIQNKTASRGFV